MDAFSCTSLCAAVCYLTLRLRGLVDTWLVAGLEAWLEGDYIRQWLQCQELYCWMQRAVAAVCAIDGSLTTAAINQPGGAAMSALAAIGRISPVKSHGSEGVLERVGPMEICAAVKWATLRHSAWLFAWQGAHRCG